MYNIAVFYVDGLKALVNSLFKQRQWNIFDKYQLKQHRTDGCHNNGEHNQEQTLINSEDNKHVYAYRKLLQATKRKTYLRKAILQLTKNRGKIQGMRQFAYHIQRFKS